MGRRSRPASLLGVITLAEDNRVGVTAAVVDALGKHFATHTIAKGQDFWQSGNGWFWPGQSGMPSGMDAMSAIVATGSTAIVTAADGVTIGAVRRLTTARMESRRGKRVQNFTLATWHMVQCKKRCPTSNFRQVTPGP